MVLLNFEPSCLYTSTITAQTPLDIHANCLLLLVVSTGQDEWQAFARHLQRMSVYPYLRSVALACAVEQGSRLKPAFDKFSLTFASSLSCLLTCRGTQVLPNIY